MDKREYELIPVPLTDEEVRHMGESLARETQNIQDLREQKAAAMATFNGAIKEASQRAAETAVKVNNRYELREVEVVRLMDTPRPGMKAIARIENPDEVIRIEPMTAAEKQGTFGFSLSEDDEGGEK